MHHRPRRRTASPSPLTTVYTRITDSVGTRIHNNPSMSSDTEGEKTVAAQAAVHFPPGNAAGKDDDDYDDLVDYNSEGEGGAAAPSLVHDVDQANDGQKAPEQASTQSNLEEQDSGGDQTIEKEKIANVAYLACNMLGTDRDLAKPATEWGYTQLTADRKSVV